MNGQLLAVVGVEQNQRVACQAPGCGRGVYRQIHVVRRDDGTLGVYGFGCFRSHFRNLAVKTPRYGSSEGRELTPDERLLLVENTAQLIAQFEARHQSLLEQVQPHARESKWIDMPAHEQEAKRKAAGNRRLPLTAAELAPVEEEARAAVRRLYGDDVDLNTPGWRGLVLQEARKLLGR